MDRYNAFRNYGTIDVPNKSQPFGNYADNVHSIVDEQHVAFTTQRHSSRATATSSGKSKMATSNRTDINRRKTGGGKRQTDYPANTRSASISFAVTRHLKTALPRTFPKWRPSALDDEAGLDDVLANPYVVRISHPPEFIIAPCW